MPPSMNNNNCKNNTHSPNNLLHFKIFFDFLVHQKRLESDT